METIESKGMDLDDVLPRIGGFGRYQKLVLFLICLPCVIPCSITAFQQIFTADTPPHWCRVPELHFLPIEQRRHLSIPMMKENSTWNSCRRYAINWTKILQMETIDNIVPNASWPTEPCIQGYEYDSRIVPSSVVIDFNLVCEYDIYPSIGLFILNVGNVFGLLIFGYLNDKYGRRKSYFMVLTMQLFGNIMTIFAPNFGIWALARFFVGSSISSTYQIPFILSVELVGPKHRSFINLMTSFCYTFGYLSLCAVAYLLVNNWVYLTLATSLPFSLYYIYWFFMPESPRWLLIKGRHDDAAKMLEKIAKINNHTLVDGTTELLMIDSNAKGKKTDRRSSPKILGLFRTPNMRKKSILIIVIWFLTMSTDVGLSYYGPSLGSNKYMSFLLLSLVEVPSYIFMHFTMNKWGRRVILSTALIMAGFSSMSTPFFNSEVSSTILIPFLMLKCSMSISAALLYLYAGELFPTELRGLGLGTVAYVGCIGISVMPFINYLGNDNKLIPLLIMGTLAFIASFLSMRLPETLNQPLPQTVEQAEEFGKDWTIKECFKTISAVYYKCNE